jgi:deoxyadenosine/deoxycytidine kinase
MALTYRRLLQSLTQSITPPTLLVFLHASVPTLLGRINGRSRAYERAIPADYLAQLNRRYEEWLRRFELCPVLTIETDALDFAHDVSARREVVELIGQAAGIRGVIQERMMA